MTTNQERAALTLAEIEQYVDVRERQHILTAVLAAAEARGRAEKDEQTGAIVAALVARAELAEAAVRAGLALADELEAQALDHKRKGFAQRNDPAERVSHLTHVIAGAYQEDATRRLRAVLTER